MKIRFYFVWSHVGKDMYGHEPRLWRASELIDAPPVTVRSYRKYLLSALKIDFSEHHPEMVDVVLQDIEKLERCEIEIASWGGDPGFEQTITREGVTFENGTFGECPEWPLWSCPLAHYKAALQGWRKFLDMPKSVDSELIVELPD